MPSTSSSGVNLALFPEDKFTPLSYQLQSPGSQETLSETLGRYIRSVVFRDGSVKGGALAASGRLPPSVEQNFAGLETMLEEVGRRVFTEGDYESDMTAEELRLGLQYNKNFIASKVRELESYKEMAHQVVLDWCTDFLKEQEEERRGYEQEARELTEQVRKCRDELNSFKTNASKEYMKNKSKQFNFYEYIFNPAAPFGSPSKEAESNTPADGWGDKPSDKLFEMHERLQLSQALPAAVEEKMDQDSHHSRAQSPEVKATRAPEVEEDFPRYRREKSAVRSTPVKLKGYVSPFAVAKKDEPRRRAYESPFTGQAPLQRHEEGEHVFKPAVPEHFQPGGHHKAALQPHPTQYKMLTVDGNPVISVKGLHKLLNREALSETDYIGSKQESRDTDRVAESPPGAAESGPKSPGSLVSQPLYSHPSKRTEPFDSTQKGAQERVERLTALNAASAPQPSRNQARNTAAPLSPKGVPLSPKGVPLSPKGRPAAKSAAARFSERLREERANSDRGSEASHESAPSRSMQPFTLSNSVPRDSPPPASPVAEDDKRIHHGHSESTSSYGVSASMPTPKEPQSQPLPEVNDHALSGSTGYYPRQSNVENAERYENQSRGYSESQGGVPGSEGNTEYWDNQGNETSKPIVDPSPLLHGNTAPLPESEREDPGEKSNTAPVVPRLRLGSTAPTEYSQAGEEPAGPRKSMQSTGQRSAWTSSEKRLKSPPRNLAVTPRSSEEKGKHPMVAARKIANMHSYAQTQQWKAQKKLKNPVDPKKEASREFLRKVEEENGPSPNKDFYNSGWPDESRMSPVAPALIQNDADSQSPPYLSSSAVRPSPRNQSSSSPRSMHGKSAATPRGSTSQTLTSEALANGQLPEGFRIVKSSKGNTQIDPNALAKTFNIISEAMRQQSPRDSPDTARKSKVEQTERLRKAKEARQTQKPAQSKPAQPKNDTVKTSSRAQQDAPAPKQPEPVAYMASEKLTAPVVASGGDDMRSVSDLNTETETESKFSWNFDSSFPEPATSKAPATEPAKKSKDVWGDDVFSVDNAMDQNPFSFDKEPKPQAKPASGSASASKPKEDPLAQTTKVSFDDFAAGMDTLMDKKAEQKAEPKATTKTEDQAKPPAPATPSAASESKSETVPAKLDFNQWTMDLGDDTKSGDPFNDSFDDNWGFSTAPVPASKKTTEPAAPKTEVKKPSGNAGNAWSFDDFGGDDDVFSFKEDDFFGSSAKKRDPAPDAKPAAAEVSKKEATMTESAPPMEQPTKAADGAKPPASKPPTPSGAGATTKKPAEKAAAAPPPPSDPHPKTGRVYEDPARTKAKGDAPPVAIRTASNSSTGKGGVLKKIGFGRKK